MARTHPAFALMCALVADDTRFNELEARLLADSNLPNSRLNLELAAERVAAASASHRRSDDFAILSKGPGYALSVFVAVAPERGFARLAEWVTSEDSDVTWIVREMLKTNCLSRPFPAEVERVAGMLDRPDTSQRSARHGNAAHRSRRTR